MSIDDESRLARLRLKSLVASHQRRLGDGADVEEVKDADFSLGASAIIGTSGWVLVLQTPERGLGPSLLWMNKHHLNTVNVIVETNADIIARRAQLFALNIKVWSVVGNELVAAMPSPVEPRVSVPVNHLKFAEFIELAGATVVSEYGVLAGEVMGLEVCRVVEDPRSKSGARLEIGVGIHDRQLFQMVNGNSPTVESLTKVVHTVLRYRHARATQHPLNRLGSERYFRELLIANPDLVGANSLTRVEPPVVRSNLKDAIPCVAFGETADSAIVVVCSATVDPDLVPFAADARLALEPNADLVLATAPNNVFPSMTLLADSLQQRARFVVVDEFRR